MAPSLYPSGQFLANLMLDELAKHQSYECLTQGRTVFYHVSIFDRQYYLYFKCVSHEGKPYPKEHRRAQLPCRDEFEAIKDDDIPFLFMGYDVDNDLFVCWEPNKVKARLNARRYVSFYSRLSVQESVEYGSILQATLTNDDKYVLFKRCDALLFFETIDEYFEQLLPTLSGCSEDDVLYNHAVNVSTDPATDVNVLAFLKQYSPETLTIYKVQGCMDKFGKKYPDLGPSEWRKVIVAICSSDV